MTNRCPSAKFLAVAVLSNHRLDFTYLSKGRKCGVADAVPDPGRETWGVVYSISSADLMTLDGHEGYKPERTKNAYRRESVVVSLEDKARTQQNCWTYFVQTKSPQTIPPSKMYMDLLVKGAEFWQLPQEYKLFLKRVPLADEP